jgi:hypothetical protein
MGFPLPEDMRKFLESVDFKKLKHVLQRDVRVVGRH